MSERLVTSPGATVRWATVCAVLLVAAGCRETPTTVQGLVTLDGRPLSMHHGMRGTVVFQPTTSDGRTLSGTIDEQGHYKLSSGSSNVVTSSVYWATVSAMEIVPPSDEHPQPTGRRITPAKYASAADSGFRIEVRPGENVVDLALVSDRISTEPGTPADATPAPTTGNVESAQPAGSRDTTPAPQLEIPAASQQGKTS